MESKVAGFMEQVIINQTIKRAKSMIYRSHIKRHFAIKPIIIAIVLINLLSVEKLFCQRDLQSGHFFIASSLQYSTVEFFNDNMLWNENKFEMGWHKFLKARFSFLFEDFKRFDDRDQVSSVGLLYFFADTSHINTKLSFGHEVIFLHKFRVELEYSRKLFKNTFAHTKFGFWDYPKSNLYLFEIGATYYNLKHSFHIRLFIPKASERENSSSYMLEWRNSFNGMKNWFLFGIAYGSRFIDSVPSKKSSDQNAIAIYFNIENQIKRNLSLGTNLTYLKEKPDLVLLRSGIYLTFKF